MPRVKVTGRELAAGAFVTVALAGALYLVYRAVPWARSHDVRFHALLERSYGLRDGSPVRMRGVIVGRVTSARLLASGGERGKVRVDFFVRESLDGERLADLFSESGAAAATLTPEGSLLLGGQSALAIEPGAVGPPVADGSRPILAVVAPEDLETLAKDTLREIRTTAASISGLADGIAARDSQGRTLAERISSLAAGLEELTGRPAHDGVAPQAGSLASVVASLDEFAKSIRDPRQGTVGRLVSSAELHEKLVARLERADEVLAGAQRAIDALAADARRLLDAATKIAEHADRTGIASAVTGDDASGAQLSATIDAARRTLAHLEAVSSRLPAVAEDASRAIEGGRRVVGNAEDAFAGARRHWLLSGLFARPSDPWLRLHDFGDDAEGAK